MRVIRMLGALALGLAFVAATDARAADFTIMKNLGTDGAGTFTFTDTNPSDPVFEIVVSGLGLSAGTTRPGFSASTILFGSDPQNCLPVLGSTIWRRLGLRVQRQRGAEPAIDRVPDDAAEHADELLAARQP